jgi:GR25 family glycosyltransferase involved in LPS biosynthesis
MKAEKLVSACTWNSGVRVIAGFFGLVLIVYIQTSAKSRDYQKLYLQNKGRLRVTAESHVFAFRQNKTRQNETSQNYQHNTVNVKKLDKELRVNLYKRLDTKLDKKIKDVVPKKFKPTKLNCVHLPTICKDNKVAWPKCSFSGKQLPHGYDLCSCTNSSVKGISYDEYAKISEKNNFLTRRKCNTPVFFINMDQSTERRTHFCESLGQVFSTIIRFSAVNTSSDKLKSFQNRYRATNDHIMAVLLSQRGVVEMALRYCEENNKTYAIIMEDDASLEFSMFWHRPLDEIINNAPKDWLSIQLGYTRMSFMSGIPIPYYYQFGRDSRGRARSKEDFKAGFLKGNEWGAFAYAIKVEGMKKLLARRFADMKRTCPPLTADDCFLGFSPGAFAKTSPLNKHNYLAVPPVFGVNVDLNPTHRKSADREMHWNAAVAGQCMSLYDNVWYFNSKL